MKENNKNLWSKTKECYKKIALTTHLKIVVCFLLIPMIIFFSLPFLSASAELSLKGQALNNSKSVDLLSRDDEITSFTVFDMLNHKELPQYSIYGTKISDFNVFGIPVYQLLTTPLPSYGVIDQISDFVNSDAVDILKNDDIKNMLNDNFGDIGSSIVNVMDSLSLYVDDARNLVDSAKNISNSIMLASNSVVDRVNQINNVKTKIEWGFYSIPILALIGAVLLFIKRKPTMAPAIVFTILFAVIGSVGIGVNILNNIIASKIDNELSNINSVVSSALLTYVPGLPGVLALFGVSTDVVFGVYINTEIGYHLLLILSAVMAVISYFIVFYSRHLDKKSLSHAIESSKETFSSKLNNLNISNQTKKISNDDPKSETQEIKIKTTRKKPVSTKIDKNEKISEQSSDKNNTFKKEQTMLEKNNKGDGIPEKPKPKNRTPRKPQVKTEKTEDNNKKD